MTDVKHNILPGLLGQAKRGDAAARGAILEQYRTYLTFLAHRYLNPKIRVKADADDLVQATYVQALEKFEQFAGTTLAEFKAWLRAILAHHLEKVVRHFETDKRDIHREIRLCLEESSCQLERLIPADGDKTPSTKMQDEDDLLRLAKALMLLSVDHRTVIIGKEFEGLTFRILGERMGRSAEAARLLWIRAMQKLCEILAEEC